MESLKSLEKVELYVLFFPEGKMKGCSVANVLQNNISEETVSGNDIS